MPNPNPKLPPEFVAKQFKAPDVDEPLAKKQIQIRLPKELDRKVRAMPNMSQWLRVAIAKAMEEYEAQQKISSSTKEPFTLEKLQEFRERVGTGTKAETNPPPKRRADDWTE